MSNPSRPPLPPPPAAPPSSVAVVDPATPFDRVLISVDGSDASLPHHSPTTPSTTALYPQPIRALSLNRLDTMDDSPTATSFSTRPTDGTTANAAGDFCLYRCPSLPGMDRHLSASARTVSTTNLETDLESLSPRVSTTTLSQDFDCRDRFGLSLGSMPSFLARSTSARTIEGLPPPLPLPPPYSTGDPPQPPTSLLKPTTDLLATPHVTAHVTAAAAGHVIRRKSYVRVVYRSTSCPTLTDAGRSFFHPGTWVHQHRQRPVLRTQSPRADVNLDGEEIKDLPIEPRKNFPEFSPDLIEGTTGSGLKPSYSAQRHRPSQAELDGTAPVSTTTTQRLSDGAEGNARHLPGAVKNCFNIGDVPSSFARPIFAKEQRAPRLVQIKCLQWLNSLDSNR